jgi:N-sulfoglucosamine sulfohydrolase
VPTAETSFVVANTVSDRGGLYTKACATNPVCSRTRSCLITGVYATSLGTQNLRWAFPVPGFMRRYPAYLRDAGGPAVPPAKTDPLGLFIRFSLEAALKRLGGER